MGTPLIFFFFFATLWHKEFPGQGSGPSCSYHDTGSLAHGVLRGLNLCPVAAETTANLISPRKELPFTGSKLAFLSHSLQENGSVSSKRQFLAGCLSLEREAPENQHFLFFSFSFLVTPMACRNSRARDPAEPEQ